MKIFITGNKGLIGSAIQNKLKLKHEVDGIDKKDLSHDEISLGLVVCNIEVDMIIHCASNCLIREVIKDPRLAQENINSAFDVMEYARRTGCKKVIMFSSSRVQHSNKNPYTVSKQFNEQICEAYKECYGIDYVIIQPECVWSETEDPVRVIPCWINKAINNKPIVVYGDKKKELTPLHINDFMITFIEIFNNFENYKFKTIPISGHRFYATYVIDEILKYSKSKSKVIFKDPEKSQPQRSANFEASCDVFDFRDHIKRIFE